MPRRAFLHLLGLLATGCSASAVVEEATPTSPPDTPTPVFTPTPLPPTATPTATPVPPTPTPSGGISFKPAQIVQGGTAIVYLHESASSATLRFQERQYPMLHDGNRWWTIIGVGALIQPGLHPISVIYTPTGATAARSVVQSITVVDREFPIEYITLGPAEAALLAPDIVQAELTQRASIFSGFTAQRLWSGAFQAPGRGAISSIYGEGRSYNNGPVTDYHRGTDFVGEIGAPVYAASGGRVVFTGALRVRGNAVMIDHGAGVFTAYHHLSEIAVNQGQMVHSGDRIGAIGSTGLVTGPHLHWEVIVRGVEVDGELWLKGEEVRP
jgi:murein DD-endopeptidase MepM/ murein hydrolase activator NlpD